MSDESEIMVGWRPIKEMKDHVHGLYLCLIKLGDHGDVDDYSVQERYFTYNDKHESTFQDDEDAEGVVSFMVPRFYPSFGEDEHKGRYDRLEAQVKELKKEVKNEVV